MITILLTIVILFAFLLGGCTKPPEPKPPEVARTKGISYPKFRSPITEENRILPDRFEK